MTPTPKIDTIEAVLAVTGVTPLITKDVERFTKAQLDEASTLPAQIAKLARQLAHDEVEPAPLFETSYEKTLRDLYDEWQPKQLEQMAGAFSKWLPGVEVGYMSKAKEVLDFLRSIFPRSTYETFLGSANLVPNDMAIYAFESVLEVLDAPLKVFSLIAQGAISKRQVAAVRLVYPTLSAAIDEAIIDGLASAKSERASWELAPAAELGAKKWFGKPAMPPAQQNALQASFAKPAPDQQQAPPAPAAGRTNALAKEALSPAQRSAEPTAIK